jgi:hypothetical protein
MAEWEADPYRQPRGAGAVETTITRGLMPSAVLHLGEKSNIHFLTSTWTLAPKVGQIGRNAILARRVNVAETWPTVSLSETSNSTVAVDDLNGRYARSDVEESQVQILSPRPLI